MAARRLVRQHVAPVMTSAMIFSMALFPTTTLHAELPERKLLKKPIYDESGTSESSTQTTSPPSVMKEAFTKPKSLTPTGYLSIKIRDARLLLHGHVSYLEDKFNGYMNSAFKMEESFTSTIASLAPAPHTGEKIMPGSVYVLVAAMAGSIFARNSNILFRTSLPLLFGIASGWIFIPVTFHNISNLIWIYEQRFPKITDTHIRSREAIEKTREMAKFHSNLVVDIVNNKVSAGRSAIEEWIKQGK